MIHDAYREIEKIETILKNYNHIIRSFKEKPKLPPAHSPCGWSEDMKRTYPVSLRLLPLSCLVCPESMQQPSVCLHLPRAGVTGVGHDVPPRHIPDQSKPSNEANLAILAGLPPGVLTRVGTVHEHSVVTRAPGMWLGWKSACLSLMKSWVCSPPPNQRGSACL